MVLNAPLPDNIPGLILECDAGLRVLYASLSASRDFGYNPDEITGRTLTDFVHPEDGRALRRVFGRVSRSPGTCSKAAFRFRHKRGLWRYLQGEARSYADGPGAAKIIIHAYDLTREKRKEKRFAESEDLYRTAVEHSVSAMAVVRGGRHIRVNKRFLELFGCEKLSDVIGKPVSIIAHPDDSHILVERSVRRERGEPVPSRYTFRGFRRDGEQVVIEVSGTRIFYRGKAASLNLLRDITERRKVEEKLRKSEATMRLVFSASPVGIVLLGENMIVTGINHRINSITGYRPEELIGQDTGMLYATDEERLRVHETVYEDVRQCGMGSMDAKWVRKNGEIRDVYLNAAAIDPGDLSMGMIVTAVDITERKKMDEALRKSEEKYRNIFERSVEGIFQTTPDGKFISANPALARMHGFESPEQFLTHANEEGFRPIVNAGDLTRFGRILKEKGFIERFEMQALKKDGNIIWASVSARRVEDAATGAAHLEGTVEDITRRKTAELALRESEKRYKNLFEYANDAIFLIRDHRFMDCNSKSLEMFKCSRDDLIGESIHRFSPPLQPEGEDSREKIAEKVSVAGLGKPQSFEWRHLRADGTPFDAEVSLSNLETRNDRLALFIVRDITDRKRSEQMLSKAMSDLETMNVELKNANIELRESQKKITQQEKMASIGQLAAGGGTRDQ